tara:strand:- start:21 stop:410 length:390 start_codon:yes stop_codon:yes gene_type:complete
MMQAPIAKMFGANCIPTVDIHQLLYYSQVMATDIGVCWTEKGAMPFPHHVHYTGVGIGLGHAVVEVKYSEEAYTPVTFPGVVYDTVHVARSIYAVADNGLYSGLSPVGMLWYKKSRPIIPFDHTFGIVG